MPRQIAEQDIIRTLQQLQRSYERVYPFMIAARLDYPRHEATIRRDLNRLAEQGRVVRLGGPRSRRGWMAAA